MDNYPPTPDYYPTILPHAWTYSPQYRLICISPHFFPSLLTSLTMWPHHSKFLISSYRFLSFLYRNIAIPRVETRRNQARAVPDFWFFGYFLSFHSQITSANVHKPRRHWSSLNLVYSSPIRAVQGLFLHAHIHSHHVHWHTTKSRCSTRVNPCLDRHPHI